MKHHILFLKDFIVKFSEFLFFHILSILFIENLEGEPENAQNMTEVRFLITFKNSFSGKLAFFIKER